MNVHGADLVNFSYINLGTPCEVTVNSLLFFLFVINFQSRSGQKFNIGSKFSTNQWLQNH